MCRMLMILGKRIGREYMEKLYLSLINSSKNDPYGESLKGKKGFSHKDGWGRIIVLYNNDSHISRIQYEKSVNPIFKDNPQPMNSGYSNMFVEFVHARAASRNMPVNLASTHPISYFTRNGEPLYLIHNGSVLKDELAKITGSNDNEKSLYTDTYFLAKFFGGLEKLDGEKHVYEALRYVKSALNIGLLVIQEKTLLVTIGSFYKEDLEGKRKGYYKMYMGEDEDKIIYASSTMIDYYNPRIDIKWRELKNGEYHVYKLDGKELKRTHTILL